MELGLAALGLLGAAGAGAWAGHRLARGQASLSATPAGDTGLEAAFAAAGGVALVFRDSQAMPELRARPAALRAVGERLGLGPNPDAAALLTAIEAGTAGEAIARFRATGAPLLLALGRVDVWGAAAGANLALLIRPAVEEAGGGGLLAGAPFPAWRTDAEGRLLWANERYLSAVEAPGLADALARNLQLEPRLMDEARLAAAGAVRSAQQAVVMGGRRRILDVMLHPVPGGATGAAFDVTEEAEARDALARETRAYSETLNHLTDAVAVFGPDKKLVFRNSAFGALWGLDPSWLESRPSHGDFLDELRQRRRLPAQGDYASFKARELEAYTNAVSPPETVWTLPDGRSLRVLRQRQPSGGLLLLFEDISDTLDLRARFKTLIDVQRATLDGLGEGVAVFAGDGRLKLHNQAFARLWRLAPELLAAEPDFAQVAAAARPLFPEDAVWSALQSRVADPSPHARTETRGEMARTDDRVLLYQTTPLPDGATLIAFTDATDSRQLQSTLSDRAAAFEAADQLKTEFVRNVSYQLRNPLNAIKGFAEMLAGQFFDPLTIRQQDYVSSISAGADQLSRLIDNMLDLAMIDAGKMELTLGDVRLADILAEAAEHARSELKASQVQIVVDAPDDLGLIRADERRLRQVLFGLVTNAMAHVGPGDTVKISGVREGDAVELSVADTGRGLEPERQAAAFDGFSSKADRRGAGVGLSLVKRFIELHGGWVSMTSAPGRGVTVTCYLPADAAGHAAPPELKLTA